MGSIEVCSVVLGWIAVWLPKRLCKRVALANSIEQANLVVSRLYWATVIKFVVFVGLVVMFLTLPVFMMNGKWFCCSLVGCQVFFWSLGLRQLLVLQ